MLRIIPVLFLVGCSQVAGDFCDAAFTHRFSDETVAVMNRAELEQENRHNRAVERLCP